MKNPKLSALTASALAFAVAFLVMGPAAAHPQAGPVTHALYVAVLLAGVVDLAVVGLTVAGLNLARQR